MAMGILSTDQARIGMSMAAAPVDERPDGPKPDEPTSGEGPAGSPPDSQTSSPAASPAAKMEVEDWIIMGFKKQIDDLLDAKPASMTDAGAVIVKLTSAINVFDAMCWNDPAKYAWNEEDISTMPNFDVCEKLFERDIGMRLGAPKAAGNEGPFMTELKAGIDSLTGGFHPITAKAVWEAMSVRAGRHAGTR